MIYDRCMKHMQNQILAISLSFNAKLGDIPTYEILEVLVHAVSRFSWYNAEILKLFSLVAPLNC